MEKAVQKEPGPPSESEDTLNVEDDSFGVVQPDAGSEHLVTVLDDSTQEQMQDLEQMLEERSVERLEELVLLQRSPRQHQK